MEDDGGRQGCELVGLGDFLASSLAFALFPKGG